LYIKRRKETSINFTAVTCKDAASFKQLITKTGLKNVYMLCCPNCSQLCAKLNSIIEPKSGVTMLNNNEQLPTMWVTLFNAVFINHDEQVDNFCCAYLGHHLFLQVG
jgi:hypothetical protein